MNKTTFILLGVTYYIVSVLIIIVVLNKINKKEKNKYKQEIEELERDKKIGRASCRERVSSPV